MEKQNRVFWPGFVTLLLLSPLVAELLSGSAPPVEFFSPLSLLILVTWYGLGALLCRELALRWDCGLAGLFLLGAAFGIAEEGILVKTFFDPGAIDLGILQGFGWWAGANWPWIVELTLYHAVVSISLPVLVVASLWPEQRATPWLSPRAMRVVLGLLAAMALAGWFLLSPAGEWPPFRPGAGQFLGALGAVALLAALARQLRPRPTGSPVRRLWPLFVAGLGWGPWLLGAWLIADTTRAAWPTMLWTLAVAALLLAFAYQRLHALNHQALLGAGALAAGAWLFWSLLAIVQELDKTNRPDDTTGMALVGLLALGLLLAYLFYLRRAWRHLGNLNQEEPGPGSGSRPAGAASV